MTQARFAGGRSEKGGLSAVAFDQRKIEIRVVFGDSQNNTGQASATAEIKPSSAGGVAQIRYLETIDDVAIPEIVDGCRRYQIDAPISFAQKVRVDRQLVLCFT